MGRLHAREQEAVDLLYYLWKAYKAAPDDEFVVYIKDLKSQGDRIPSTTPGAEPPRDAKDSGSARPHSTHPETSSTNRP